MLYPKFGSEPEKVFSIPKDVTLTGSDGTSYIVNVRGVASIKMAQSSSIKFSGVFSTDEGALLYFKYSGSALEIFSLTSRIGLPIST